MQRKGRERNTAQSAQNADSYGEQRKGRKIPIAIGSSAEGAKEIQRKGRKRLRKLLTLQLKYTFP
jgi:hypothetical protein